MITELFYSHILNINTGYLYTRRLRPIYNSLFLDTDELKIALWAPNLFGAFKTKAPEHGRYIKP